MIFECPHLHDAVACIPIVIGRMVLSVDRECFDHYSATPRCQHKRVRENCEEHRDLSIYSVCSVHWLANHQTTGKKKSFTYLIKIRPLSKMQIQPRTPRPLRESMEAVVSEADQTTLRQHITRKLFGKENRRVEIKKNKYKILKPIKSPQ